MDQRQNELSRVTDDGESPDAVSTAAGATSVSTTPRLGDYPISEMETESLATNTSSDDLNKTNEQTAEETAETEEIRAQIEQTRSSMGDTIDAIQERLTFSNIADQVKEQVSEQITSAVETASDAVYGATIGKAGNFMQNVSKNLGSAGRTLAKSDVGRIAAQNPIPLVFIGIGIGMLFLQGSRRKNNNRSDKRARGYRYDYAAESGNYYDERENYERNRKSTLASAGETVGNVANQAYSGVSSAAGQAYSGVSNAAGQVYSSVSSAASQTYSGVGSLAESAGEQVANAGTQAKRFAGQAQSQYDYYLEENPLAVGAVALALGAAVGFSIPSTDVEGNLMGETRQNLYRQAETAARDAYGSLQQAAGDLTQTVRDELSNKETTH